MKRIKKCKNSLLSLLLLSFAFLVLHDFTMPGIESVQSHHSALDSTVYSTLEKQQTHDTSEDIHEIIHAIVAIDIFMQYYSENLHTFLNPRYIFTKNDSQNLSVLERPPLY